MVCSCAGPAQIVFCDQPEIGDLTTYGHIVSPVHGIRLCVVSQIMGMLHDPLTFGGVLPFQQGCSDRDVGIFRVADVESVECDLHDEIRVSAMGNISAMTPAQVRAIS